MKIIDMGSGNNCKNDREIVDKMIDTLAEIDKERKCILKWQLFIEAGDNIPLKPEVFQYAYITAMTRGFKTTASVFDETSLDYLLVNFAIPFIKIANNPGLYPLINQIPRGVPVIVSFNDFNSVVKPYLYNGDRLACVSEYPAKKEDYIKQFSSWELHQGISDHTDNWELYNEYKPEIFEVHFKLPETTGLDAGDFARTPQQLAKILI